MGKQSALIYFNRDDHKEIYFNGSYHDAMYKGSELLWEKLTFNRLKEIDSSKIAGIPINILNNFQIYVDDSGYQYFISTDGDASYILNANNDVLSSSVIDGNCESVDGIISEKGIWYYSNQGYFRRVLASAGTFNAVNMLTGNATYLLNKPKNYLRNINPSVMLADGRIFCPMGKIGYSFTSESDGANLYVPYQWNYPNASAFSYYMWLIASKENSQYSYSRFCTDDETRTRLFGIRHIKGTADDFSDCLTEIVEVNHSFSDITSASSADSSYTNDTFSDVNVLLQFTGHYNIDSNGNCKDDNRIFKCVNNTLFVKVVEEDSETETLYAINVNTKEVQEIDVPLGYIDNVFYIYKQYVFAGNISEKQGVVVSTKGKLVCTTDFKIWELKGILIDGETASRVDDCYMKGNVLYFRSGGYFYKSIL